MTVNLPLTYKLSFRGRGQPTNPQILCPNTQLPLLDFNRRTFLLSLWYLISSFKRETLTMPMELPDEVTFQRSPEIHEDSPIYNQVKIN